MTVLVIGATGKFAGFVLPALAQRGARVRGFAHKPEQAEEVRSRGAAEVAVGDLRDGASLERALAGIDSVFYLAPAFISGEAALGRSVVDAAIRAGVRRFVFSSVIHPVLSDLVNHVAKASVEEAVLNSDLEYVFLHPTRFFQNYAVLWPGVSSTGVLAEPWSPDTRFTRVDYRDVAEVAAIALTEDRLLYGTFELCAPGNLSSHEVAALIGEILGREVKAKRGDPGVFRDASPPMKAMFEHYDHHGLLGNPLTLSTILGREPRTLRAYFAELARVQP